MIIFWKQNQIKFILMNWHLDWRVCIYIYIYIYTHIKKIIFWKQNQTKFIYIKRGVVPPGLSTTKGRQIKVYLHPTHPLKH